MHDVIGRDDADEPSRAIDNSGRNKRIFLEPKRDFFLIHIHGNQRLFVLHDVADRNLALAAHDPAELARTHGLMLRVDDKHFPELCGQLMMVAQIVDELTHGHMLGHRHKLALHDTASGFFGVGQRVFDDGAVFGVQLGKNGLLVLFLHILDDRDRVIGIQLSSKPGNLRCGQGVNDILADIVIDLGQHFGAHQLAHADGKVTAPFRRR